jgi:GNAT superfamily N-acetyltransferase
MNYSIRKSRPSDIDEIIKLIDEHASYEGEQYDSNGMAEKLSSFLFCENPPLHCLIAESENDILGYATYMFEFSTWDAGYYVHMDCLYLKSSARGTGIGKALINEILKRTEENNCNLMQWQTPVLNKRAISFYYGIGAIAKEKLRMYLKGKVNIIN